MTPRTYSDGLLDAARMVGVKRHIGLVDSPEWFRLNGLMIEMSNAADAADLPPPPPSATFWLGEQGV